MWASQGPAPWPYLTGHPHPLGRGGGREPFFPKVQGGWGPATLEAPGFPVHFISCY